MFCLKYVFFILWLLLHLKVLSQTCKESFLKNHQKIPVTTTYPLIGSDYFLSNTTWLKKTHPLVVIAEMLQARLTLKTIGKAVQGSPLPLQLKQSFVLTIKRLLLAQKNLKITFYPRQIFAIKRAENVLLQSRYREWFHLVAEPKAHKLHLFEKALARLRRADFLKEAEVKILIQTQALGGDLIPESSKEVFLNYIRSMEFIQHKNKNLYLGDSALREALKHAQEALSDKWTARVSLFHSPLHRLNKKDTHQLFNHLTEAGFSKNTLLLLIERDILTMNPEIKNTLKLHLKTFSPKTNLPVTESVKIT